MCENEHCKAENCTCDPCECTEEKCCDCDEPVVMKMTFDVRGV